jgi:Leu/Phe-tRNA-protein transferase
MQQQTWRFHHKGLSSQPYAFGQFYSAATMTIDIDLLIRAYRHGVFPMADSRTDPNAYWVEPK